MPPISYEVDKDRENCTELAHQSDLITGFTDDEETVQPTECDYSQEQIQLSNEFNATRDDHKTGHDFIVTGWNEVAPKSGQKRHHSPNQDKSHMRDRRVGLDGPKYDQVMTGWDELPRISGQKRQHSPDTKTMRTKRGREVKKIDYYRLHHGMSALLSADPKTWNKAMTSSDAMHWKKAANEEFKSLKETGTIKIIDRSKLPKGRTLMKSKWVFKKKYLADGTLEKYRARCTVKGFTQRFGVDYHETFAPTPRPETARIMLVLAHRFGWHRRQGDVPAAFLNPDLDVDLYMELPEGFKKENKITLIRKSLYGLKQAAALWYDDEKRYKLKSVNTDLFKTWT